MKLFTAEQIRNWDEFTILHQPVSSIHLMERAASKCTEWLTGHFSQSTVFEVFCGKGNNGGDGLAIARQLVAEGKNVTVYLLGFAKKGSEDFEINLQRLRDTNAVLIEIETVDTLQPLQNNSIVIDALFGTGLKHPLEQLAAQTVAHINAGKNPVVSIDLPSGMPADLDAKFADYKDVINASFTLTFQVPKQSFLFEEMGKYVGNLVIVDIGLSAEYENTTVTNYYWTDEALASQILKPRNRFSHKGTYGHALLIGGSMGKTGAILLATKACIRAGAGLTTAFVARCAYLPLQTAVPEAMVESIQKEDLLDFLPPSTQNYSAIGVGPGMGTQITTRDALDDFIAATEVNKLILDADALNCLSLNFLDRKNIKIPEGAILTPHPKEFDRMFGNSDTSYQRLQKQLEAAQKYKVYIVLKGTHTTIALPNGEVYFNSTGNPGMAKGGSGDVLTGIITGLRAQGYPQNEACILGVYLHGLAANFALKTQSHQSLTATDIVNCLGEAFTQIGA